MSYYELNQGLSWEDRELKETIHKFAKEVMRPIAKQLDEMSAEAGAAPDSPVWDFLAQA